MDQVVIVVVQTVLTALSTAIFGYITWLLKDDRKRKQAEADGVRCLLKVKLIEYHDKFMQKDEIPSYALENWNNMFSAYQNLGGNGVVKKMNEEIKALKIAC